MPNYRKANNYRRDMLAWFWARVEEAESGCWIWKGSVSSNGYGKFCSRKTHIGAHRFAYELSTGEQIPPGLLVLHRCDVPLCVNPSHLFLGTNSDNQIDASRKGRNANSRKTHCPQGHPYDETNTRWVVRRGSRTRQCRVCRLAIDVRAQRKRAKKLRAARSGAVGDAIR